MRRRGHALFLLMVATVAALAGLTAFSTRYLAEVEGRRALALRGQALWLARSGCSSRLAGKTEVKTELGTAVVQATPGAVEATLGGRRATVTCETLAARYD